LLAEPLSLGFCDPRSAKPELVKSKSQRSPVGKDLETYMAEMAIGENDSDAGDEEQSASDTDDEKYNGVADFEAVDSTHHNEPRPVQSEPDQTNKLQLLERLGYSPRTIMGLKTLQHIHQEVPNSIESPSEKKLGIESLSVPKFVNSSSESSISITQNKKAIAWHSEGITILMLSLFILSIKNSFRQESGTS
jgi:hypothetical protein